jgi:hypothetical protein
MSWWNLPGRPDDVIGDGPADVVAAALRRAAAGRVAEGLVPATLPELLGALGAALAQAGSVLAEPLPTGGCVVAETSTGDVAPGPADEHLIAPLVDGIHDVAAEYRERFERNPRLTEMLGVFAFVLRPDHPTLEDLKITQG